MEQGDREKKRTAKLFVVVGVLLFPFIMGMIGIFSQFNSWRPALAYSITCLVMWLFFIYVLLRWYSRVTK
jgi:hypothetical protein